LTFTLPSTASVGNSFRIVDISGLGYKIAQNSGQQIQFQSLPTTLGTGGYIERITSHGAIEIVCIVTNTTWVVVSSSGQFRVV
jgi:hypothetical protein